jgi:hypothetical protein
MDNGALRLSAALLLAGEVLLVVVGLFHADSVDANNHTAVFADYAASTTWTAVHFGQFAATAVILGGLLVLFFAHHPAASTAGWVARFAVISTVVTLKLSAVLQAVDGVALKQAVDPWASAPEAERVARFASAEAIRWLEWGIRSYQRFMLGLSLALFAAMIVREARVPRPIGYLIGLAAFAYVVQAAWSAPKASRTATRRRP